MNIDNGWTIKQDPKPIGSRAFDYEFYHENYDYCSIEGGNGLAGSGSSVSDCVSQIVEIESEHDFFKTNQQQEG